MIAGQGGDPDADYPAPGRSPSWRPSVGLAAPLDARAVGVAAWRLGAGRARKEDPVSAAAGILCHAKPGERVAAGQPVLTLHTDTPERFARAHEALKGGWTVEPEGAGGGVLGDALAGAVGSVPSMDLGTGALVGAVLAADRSVVLDRIG